jgi:EAL domain-containing protein (putative c-di-GMP-specific phosphodiesterase class I)
MQGPELRDFLLQLQGELTSQELIGSRAMSLPANTEPDFRSLKRVVSLEQMIGMSHGQWLREMIEEDRLTSFFQPIINVKEDRIQGYEALLRGKEKDGSLITPNHMFHTATDANIMFQLDLAARRSAVTNASRLGIGNHSLFINFNPTSVYDPSYCLRTTVSACENLGLDPSTIVFEVTETEEVRDIKHLKGILSFYRRAGFRVALDDVGAGYASLNTLQSLEPDVIKIDRNLITDVHKDTFRQNIVEHLVSIAKRQGIQVLAEGIEQQVEFDTLKHYGIDFAQGFLFGKPSDQLVN